MDWNYFYSFVRGQFVEFEDLPMFLIVALDDVFYVIFLPIQVIRANHCEENVHYRNYQSIFDSYANQNLILLLLCGC